MSKREAIERLCALITEVGQGVFDSEYEHDCICEQQASPPFDHRVHEDVIAFIENAVRKAI